LSRRRIVVIEDEADIRDVLRYNLEREGFEVTCATDGEEGLAAVRRAEPDLVLLDLLLPGLDGLEVCRLLKGDERTQRIPIIMVTAKGEEADIVLGLGVGADDYAPKPFSPRELVARIRAVLRRTEREAPADEGRIVRPGIVIDTVRHEVLVDGEPVALTATEFRLLLTLASHPGRVFSRDYLVGRVIGEGVSVIDRTIDVHVQSIRKKLGARRELIETIRGVGYRFQDAAAG
jgi:two-component system phosphate regulon response regulator PhoB